jgi:hypothetical protein
MAPPFFVVPTRDVVIVDDTKYFANRAWVQAPSMLPSDLPFEVFGLTEMLPNGHVVLGVNLPKNFRGTEAT